MPVGKPSRRSVDVAVVGAGVTGCSCALALAQQGLSVRVYEAREVASGASGRNGGFALRGGAPPYDRARSELAPGLARELWLLTERTIARIQRLAGDAFRPTGSWRLAADEAELADLRAEHDALIEDGFEAEWHGELEPPLSSLFGGAVRHPGDGALQPARWVRRLAARAIESGVEIAERTPVDDVVGLPAEQVVVCLDGYTHGLLPELRDFVRPTRGQVMATEPLRKRRYSAPHYARWGYDYWQQTDDRRLILGGFRDRAEAQEYTDVEATNPVIQAALDDFAAALAGWRVTVTHRWSGVFGVTPDRYPLVGRVPGRENVWVAGGYSGHGNVLGFACGELVARQLLGGSTPFDGLFDPARSRGAHL